jgi:hypothetical protein
MRSILSFSLTASPFCDAIKTCLAYYADLGTVLPLLSIAWNCWFSSQRTRLRAVLSQWSTSLPSPKWFLVRRVSPIKRRLRLASMIIIVIVSLRYIKESYKINNINNNFCPFFYPITASSYAMQSFWPWQTSERYRSLHLAFCKPHSHFYPTSQKSLYTVPYDL